MADHKAALERLEADDDHHFIFARDEFKALYAADVELEEANKEQHDAGQNYVRFWEDVTGFGDEWRVMEGCDATEAEAADEACAAASLKAMDARNRRLAALDALAEKINA